MFKRRRSLHDIRKSMVIRSADRTFCAMLEHLDRWPEDFPRMQPMISDAFLYYYRGPEGDCFRHMIWPPPLYQGEMGV